jgi:hypothetical protein
MSRFTLTLLCLVIIVAGCDNDSDDDTTRHWSMEFIIADAGAPAMGWDDNLVLLSREGATGGLFLWRNGVESRVTPEGVAPRNDYVWRPAGENLFAYSVPGLASENAGIYTVNLISHEEHRIWDRGHDPAFDDAGQYLYAAGAPDDSSESGIWRFNLAGGSRTRITNVGERPLVSPSLGKLSYLIPQLASSGGTLVVRNLESNQEQTIAEHVDNYGWADDDNLIIEVIADSIGLQIPPAIYRLRVGHSEKELIAQPAVNLHVFTVGGYAYNRLTGDVLGTLVLVANDGVQELPDSLTLANGLWSDVFVAVGPSGVTRVRKQ